MGGAQQEDMRPEADDTNEDQVNGDDVVKYLRK
jgi:hypothetical protein